MKTTAESTTDQYRYTFFWPFLFLGSAGSAVSLLHACLPPQRSLRGIHAQFLCAHAPVSPHASVAAVAGAQCSD